MGLFIMVNCLTMPKTKPFSVSQLRQMGLTQQELNKVAYHRNNLNHPGKDASGNPVTIMATGIEIPEGPLAGRQVSVPAYRDGKIISDPAALYSTWKKQIQSNYWPTYGSAGELNKRDAWIHKVVMDRDTAARGTKRVQEMP